MASVGSVSAHDASIRHFLVEWYQPALSAAPPQQTAAGLEASAATIRAHGATVHLLVAVAAPTDDVLYGVFSADSADIVLRACCDAGCPPDRLTTDVHTYLSS